MQQRMPVTDRPELESVRRRQCYHGGVLSVLASDALGKHRNRRRAARRMTEDRRPVCKGSPKGAAARLPCYAFELYEPA